MPMSAINRIFLSALTCLLLPDGSAQSIVVFPLAASPNAAIRRRTILERAPEATSGDRFWYSLDAQRQWTRSSG